MIKYDVFSLEQQDWQAYKNIRLQSLQDSPDSFGSTYEHEIKFSEDQWKSRLGVSSNSPDSMLWVAAIDKSLIGLVSSVADASGNRTANLYQMWVAPEYRGIGVGTALVNHVEDWAAKLGIQELLLFVTTTNIDAVSLYKKLRFVKTGISEPLREGSTLVVQQMKLKLATDTV